MLLLTSNGITSDSLYNRISKQIDEDRNRLALIPTASNFRENKHFNVQRHTKIFESLGLEIELFDLAERNPENLHKYDFLFFMGGNPFYLLKVMNEVKCQKILSDFMENKAIIGASAGSLVFGPTIALIERLYPGVQELNGSVNMVDFSAMGFTEKIVFSHATKELKTDSFLKCVSDFEQETGYETILIEDGQAVQIVGDFVEIV